MLRSWLVKDLKWSISGWWFGTFFIFPYIGNNNPDWLSYFSEGWLNHQLVLIVTTLIILVSYIRASASTSMDFRGDRKSSLAQLLSRWAAEQISTTKAATKMVSIQVQKEFQLHPDQKDAEVIINHRLSIDYTPIGSKHVPTTSSQCKHANMESYFKVREYGKWNSPCPLRARKALRFHVHLMPFWCSMALILKTLAFFTQCALKDQFSSSLSEDELESPPSP